MTILFRFHYFSFDFLQFLQFVFLILLMFLPPHQRSSSFIGSCQWQIETSSTKQAPIAHNSIEKILFRVAKRRCFIKIKFNFFLDERRRLLIVVCVYVCVYVLCMYACISVELAFYNEDYNTVIEQLWLHKSIILQSCLRVRLTYYCLILSRLSTMYNTVDYSLTNRLTLLYKILNLLKLFLLAIFLK